MSYVKISLKNFEDNVSKEECIMYVCFVSKKCNEFLIRMYLFWERKS